MMLNGMEPSRPCCGMATGSAIKSSERCLKAPSWGVDEWEAVCRDRRSYAVSILVEADETMITFVSCRELMATSKKLLRIAGSKSKAAGCRNQVSGRAPLKDCGAGARRRRWSRAAFTWVGPTMSRAPFGAWASSAVVC